MEPRTSFRSDLHGFLHTRIQAVSDTVVRPSCLVWGRARQGLPARQGHVHNCSHAVPHTDPASSQAGQPGGLEPPWL